MTTYSLLDLAPVPEGESVAQALENTVDLARHAESLGYHRFWLAEHHNTAGIASAATSIVIGHVAAHTERIRVGAGGIMLPNHSPLVIAEQFGTLATLYPGRIDLGLGRAPGTDRQTMRALRRSGMEAERFPHDVMELISYLDDADETQSVRAIPGAGTHVPIWILGSSTFGAQLAAHLGLPYAFASHFAPASLDAAVATYRSTFQPSRFCAAPHLMLAVNVFAAETDARARTLMSSTQLAFANLRLGRHGPLPRPIDNAHESIDPAIFASVEHALSVSAVGSQASVRDALSALLEKYEPEEVIVTGQIHDHRERITSFKIAADVMRDLGLVSQPV